MLMRDFETYRVRCRVCKTVKERKNFKRFSYRICNDCKKNYSANRIKMLAEFAS